MPTRQDADVDSFRADADRLVVEKVKQLYATAGNLLCDPQPPNSPLTGPPDRIFPVVIFGGQFPVNPLTLHYLGEQLGVAGMRPEGGIQPLTMLDLTELEECQNLHATRGLTLPQLIGEWRQSPYAESAFRDYLVYQYGGQSSGRPADLSAALTETFSVINERLGAETGEEPPVGQDPGAVSA